MHTDIKHDFHFVLNSKLKQEVIKFSMTIDKSLSQTVLYILNTVFPLAEKYHYYSSEDDNSPYFVEADTDLHIYIEEKFYRRIRNIRDQMNVWSMAIIIRKMINKFFDSVKKYGLKKFLRMMDRYRRGFYYKIRKMKRGRIIKKQDMSHSDYQKNSYKLTFSHNYNLIGVELLL